MDARLAPQYRKLLAGEEEGKAGSKTAAGKKTRVASKKEKVRGGWMDRWIYIERDNYREREIDR